MKVFMKTTDPVRTERVNILEVELCAILREMVAEVDQNSQLKLYGSASNGFRLVDSDLDISWRTSLPRDEALRKLYEIAAEKESFHCELRPSRRSPILVVNDDISGLHLEVSIRNAAAVFNSEILNQVCHLHPLVHQLGCLVKYWSRKRLPPSCNKGISPYCVILMVWYYLMQKIDDFPCVEDLLFSLQNPQYFSDYQLDQLFFGFFSFYADFDSKSTLVCVRKRHRVQKFTLHELQGKSSVARLFVRDPFIDRNVAETLGDEQERLFHDEIKRVASWKEANVENVFESSQPDKNQLNPTFEFLDGSEFSKEIAESLEDLSTAEICGFTEEDESITKLQRKLGAAVAIQGVLADKIRGLKARIRKDSGQSYSAAPSPARAPLAQGRPLTQMTSPPLPPTLYHLSHMTSPPLPPLPRPPQGMGPSGALGHHSLGIHQDFGPRSGTPQPPPPPRPQPPPPPPRREIPFTVGQGVEEKIDEQNFRLLTLALGAGALAKQIL